jgi:hypothetical protein
MKKPTFLGVGLCKSGWLMTNHHLLWLLRRWLVRQRQCQTPVQRLAVSRPMAHLCDQAGHY